MIADFFYSGAAADVVALLVLVALARLAWWQGYGR